MTFFAPSRLNLPCTVLVGVAVLAWTVACTAPVPGPQSEGSPAGESGGGQVATPDSEDLDGEWWVTEVEGVEVQADRTRRRRPHVRFDVAQRRVSFTGGCNQFAGTVEFETPGGIVMAGPFAGTRMLCPGRADYDQALTDALRSVRRWSLGTTMNDGAAVLELFVGAGASAIVRLVRPSSLSEEGA